MMEKNFMNILINVGNEAVFTGSVCDLSYDTMRIYRLISGVNQQDLAFRLNDAIQREIKEIILGVIKK